MPTAIDMASIRRLFSPDSAAGNVGQPPPSMDTRFRGLFSAPARRKVRAPPGRVMKVQEAFFYFFFSSPGVNAAVKGFLVLACWRGIPWGTDLHHQGRMQHFFSPPSQSQSAGRWSPFFPRRRLSDSYEELYRLFFLPSKI